MNLYSFAARIGILGTAVLATVCLGKDSKPEAPKTGAPLRQVSRVVTAGQADLYNCVYVQSKGLTLRASDQLSTDNGRHWEKKPMTPDYSAGLPFGYRRDNVTWALLPPNDKLLVIVNSLDTPGLDPKINEPPEAQKTYYLRYRVSTDAGRTWLFDEPVIQAGNYSAKHPCDGVWVGSNSVYLGDLGCVAIATRKGKVLVPAQTTPLGPDGELWNPSGGHSYTDVLVFIGSWTKTNRLTWEVSRVIGDPKRSSRGLIEPSLAELPDGRILMVMRGSNGGKIDPEHKLPSYKWCAVSKDGGRHWSTPEPWTFDDSQPFFSPSSMSRLFRHSSGRCFWAGNLTSENCEGNLPRWPLALAEVDLKSLKLVRSTMLTLDTQMPEDKTRGRLDISHLTMFEDRETKEIVVVYPRSYHAYQSCEWVTVRVAVK